jgi:6-phosphogluconate dehydrogenase
MIGMAVMGSNFAQNFAENAGIDIAMYNRTDSVTQERYDEIPDDAPYKKKLHPVRGNPDDKMDMKPLVDVVGPKGIYILMVKADDPNATLDRSDSSFGQGRPTQAMVDALLPHLEPGAIIVDCANSYWEDTVRRCKEIKGKGIEFFGVGVSGGEVGARFGPSIMPGGTSEVVYNERLKPLLEAVAGKAPQDGEPCVTYIGDDGAGHFVKMVHNGIEYADMQLISEAYHLMRNGLGISAPEIGDVFAKWNEGMLSSYLIEITADILHQKNPQGEGYLVDWIVDQAQMKGTGTWTVASSLAISTGVVPVPLIYSAVQSRAASSFRDRRIEISRSLDIKPEPLKDADRDGVMDDLEKALYAAKVVSYDQGFDLIQAAAADNDFGDLDIAEIAKIWRAGCIIRAQFLGEITKAYEADPDLTSLMIAPIFRDQVLEGMGAIARISNLSRQASIPAPAFDAAYNAVLQKSNPALPTNLTQAQRDFFGAHTYRRYAEADQKDPAKGDVMGPIVTQTKSGEGSRTPDKGDDVNFHTDWPREGRKEVSDLVE